MLSHIPSQVALGIRHGNSSAVEWTNTSGIQACAVITFNFSAILVNMCFI